MALEIAAVIVVTSDDPLLDATQLTETLSTIDGTLAVRRALFEAIGGSTRLICLLDVEECQMMLMEHDAAVKHVTGQEPARPPPDYVPPIPPTAPRRVWAVGERGRDKGDDYVSQRIDCRTPNETDWHGKIVVYGDDGDALAARIVALLNRGGDI